jgi:hypothetical protein
MSRGNRGDPVDAAAGEACAVAQASAKTKEPLTEGSPCHWQLVSSSLHAHFAGLC